MCFASEFPRTTDMHSTDLFSTLGFHYDVVYIFWSFGIIKLIPGFLKLNMAVIDHAFFCKRTKLKTAEMSSFLGLTKKESGHFGRFQFCQCLHPSQWSFHFESIDMLLCTVCCCNSQFWCSATEIRIFYSLRRPPWWLIRMRRLRVRSPPGWQHSFTKIDHKRFTTVIP